MVIQGNEGKMVNVKNREKVSEIFPEHGIVVDKSLGCLSEQFRALPAFVVDYLISEKVDPENPTPGLERISKLLSDHFMESDQKEWAKSCIRENGEHTFIGRIRCRFDEGRDEYWVDVTVLGNQYVRINPHLIAEYGDTLLTTGAWGVFKIVYDDSYVMRKKLYPFLVTEFRPMQITGINIDTWIQRRNRFTDDEWLDLMITSIGFDSDCLSREEKLLYMVRLVPFIEANVNLCELGPPETGKTFAYQSLSSYGFVVSGGQTTVASLFYDKLRRQLGLVGYRDVVMFDEFAGERSGNKWSGQNNPIDMLKDFMNSGRFGRGTAEFASGCSVMFAGNIDCDRQKKTVATRYRSLFAPLPQVVNNDRAFLDRIHGFIPGWKIPQIRETHLAKGCGFMADYISEIMHRMRDRNYAPVITGNVCFGNMSQRNQRSLVRVGSGLLKLMSPHKTAKTVTKDELKVVLDVAIDLRQRVLNQLATISPGEFGGIKLLYQIKV